MFEIGAGFSAYELKVFISALIIGVTYIWAAKNTQGHLKLFFAEGNDFNGMDLIQVIVQIMIVTLGISAFVALTFF